MNRTGIDYLDYTWSPLAMRCTPVSPACDNCWHLRMAKRKAGNWKLPEKERLASAGKTPPILMPDRIGEPLRLTKPRRIGVQFMGDLFHEGVEWNQLFMIFQVMGMAPQHQFLVKTKRPKRMAKELMGDLGLHLQRQDWCRGWPLPNVWLGVTAENQEQADKRIPVLLQIPAAVHFASVEPMLTSVDLTVVGKENPALFPWDVLAGKIQQQTANLGITHYVDASKLDWVICGGETGPGARPMHPEWARGLRDQCERARVPFFLKAMSIDGRVSKKAEEWPSDLRIRQVPSAL